MAEQFGDYEVLNAGCPGHLSGQELATMIHRVDDFHPVVYVVFDGWNEVVDQDFGNPRFPDEFGFNNVFFHMEGRLLDHHLQVDPWKPRLDSPRDRPSNVDVESADYRRDLANWYIANLERMHAFATARNAKFLVVFQPELGNKKYRTVGEQRVLDSWEKTGYLSRRLPEKYRDLVRFAETRLRESGIANLNLLDHAAFANSHADLFHDAVHLNDAGHAVAADKIGERLRELLKPQTRLLAN